MKNLKTITTLSMLLAISIVLNVIEMQINVIPVPGAKIGFANLVTVIALYLFGFKNKEGFNKIFNNLIEKY